MLERSVHGKPADQADGLRRLFGVRAPRLLPVILPAARCSERGAAVARIAQAFAMQDTNTLVVDAARAQLAATLGLRARYDLFHVMLREVALSSALLDAAPRLALLPAARALEAAAARLVAFDDVLDGLAATRRFDLVILLLPVTQAAVLEASRHAGDVLLPLRAGAHAGPATMQEIRQVAEALPSRSIRLLFTGPEAPSASSLFERMAPRLLPQASRCLPAGVLQTARDAQRVPVHAAQWSLATLAAARHAQRIRSEELVS
jgi:hypothetical protein